MFIKVNKDKCTACESCIQSCPFDAIVIKDDKAEITENCQLCRACLSVCPEGAINEIAEESDKKEKGQGSGVWVYAEQRDGVIAGVSFELLGIGKKLADKLGAEVSAILFGATAADAQELIRWGADRVYHCADPFVSAFNDEPYAGLLSDLIQKHKPEIVLAGATPIGRSFIPRVAARLKAGLTADCTALEIDEATKNLLQVRPAFGGNIMATILCPHTRPQMATVRPRVMKRGIYNESAKGEIIDVKADGVKSRTKVLETVKEVSDISVNLQEANVIVAGGRGTGGEKGFQLLYELAEALGASLGASRAAVDEGWIPYRHQVGQTGKTVGPRIYFACGISGAVQHVVGMQSSDIIIAINKNPEAPIFNISNFGIVGDLFEVSTAADKEDKRGKGSMKIAFVFPGQGSQAVGMGKDLWENFDEVKKLYEDASETLGYDVKDLSFNGPKEELNKTFRTQPCLLTASIAAYRVLTSHNIAATVMAGHSLGEYSAIVAAGAIPFKQAVLLTEKRGTFMQEAVPEGAGLMAAIIGLSRQKVDDICLAVESGYVSPANYNSPGQIVIAGEKSAVEEAMKLAKNAEAKKVVALAVSVPSHCTLMVEASNRLAELLNTIEIRTPEVPVVNNADAMFLTSAERIKTSLVNQLNRPLLWEDSIRNMVESGIDTIIEVGPGKVLRGLIKRIVEPSVKLLNVEDTASLNKTLEELKT